MNKIFAILMISAITLFGLQQLRQTQQAQEVLTSPQERLAWEFERLKNLDGVIPENIRARELAFSANLPRTELMTSAQKTAQWISRGPYNVGGRTRGFAIDRLNSSRIVAGGVSGGIWESLDRGASWQKITTQGQLHNVTAVLQDPRPGKESTWYYGTGEGVGNSASLPSFFAGYFYGNGVYKSTDNAQTWDSLPATAPNNPQGLTSNWQVIWRLAIDSTNSAEDELYAAIKRSIHRSTDGGQSWTEMLPLGGDYTDVLVTPDGVVYAAMSGGTNIGGIWRSPDGISWTQVSAGFQPSLINRSIMTLNPQDKDELWVFAMTPNVGFQGHGGEWMSLWKYKYLSGDGSAAGGQWTDLSQNLTDALNTQGGYDMVLRLKPDDPNFVVIGGTSLFRSTDGFQSNQNISHIGGYNLEGTHIWPGHHPDQHDFLFDPTDPDKAYSASDGGMAYTNDVNADTLDWTSLSNGYVTTQAYTVFFDPHSSSDFLLAGFQDNSTHITTSTSPSHLWEEVFLGDGSFGDIGADGSYYVSRQLAYVRKVEIDGSGKIGDYQRIDPAGGGNYLFINPLIVDPNDEDVMILPEGRRIWRNKSLTSIPLDSSDVKMSTGWDLFGDSLNGDNFTAVTFSVEPKHLLYMGTRNGKAYYKPFAHIADIPKTEITGLDFPSAYLSCLAVDPEDAGNVMAIFSSYEVYSAFYSSDSGATWIRAAGNLEENPDGSGAGPSLKWGSIMTVNGQKLYLVTGSTGLYATDTIMGDNTVWKKVAHEYIGNVVTDMVKTRNEDGLIAVATHGNGVWSTRINDRDDILNSRDHDYASQIGLKLMPNPARERIVLEFDLQQASPCSLRIMDLQGRIVYQKELGLLGSGEQRIGWELGQIPAGHYLLEMQTAQGRAVRKLIKSGG